jgi:transcriptional antiterminator RfaH
MYPESLLHEAVTDSGDRKWWALMTRSRQEKAVARHLLAREVPFYLPLIWKDHCIRGRRVRSHLPLFGRRVRSHLPLFANYLFLYGTPDERVTALQSNRLTQTLPVTKQAELLNDLRNIEQLILAGAPLTVESRLQPGRRVRIKAGGLRGIEGIVTKRRSQSRLLVAVHFLQSGVSAEIDDYMLEPID